MANITGFVEMYVTNLDEEMGDRVKYGLVVTACLVLLLNGISLRALNRTRNTPASARFLSSALLVFDFVPNLLYAVRKFVIHFKYSMVIQFIGVGWSFLAYLNIAIMCVERLMIFQWPNFYLRRVSSQVFRKISLIMWTVYLTTWTLSVGHCFVIYNSNFLSGNCSDDVIEKIVFLTCPITTIFSCSCLVKIAFIIRKHTKKVKNKSSTLKNNKSTIVVYMCFMNYLLTTFIYIVIMFITVDNNLLRRILMDALMMFNSLLDTFVYVLWYKECRMEVLKMFAVICPSLNTKIERMRVSVFDVMTFSSSNFKERKDNLTP